MKIKLKLIYEKETPGTWRYKETADEITIGTLYIKKRALAPPIPEEITVTIEAEDKNEKLEI